MPVVRIVSMYVKFFVSNFNADRKAAAVTITLVSGDSTEYTLTNLDFIIYGGDGYENVFSPAKDILLIRAPFAH